MTVADRPQRRDPLLLWLGHFSIWFLWAFIAVAITGDVSHWGFLTWPSGGMTIVMITAMVAGVRHDFRLCERCIAATPLDPQAAVQRWRPVLQAYHRYRLRMAIGLAAIAAFIAVALVRHPPWWLPVLAVAAFVIIGLLNTIQHRHRRLYPWCPWCRWEGGGDEELVPDVPAPTVSR